MALASALVIAVATHKGTLEVARHSNPNERKSDWDTVSFLYATHSEDCQEHDKAKIHIEQGT